MALLFLSSNIGGVALTRPGRDGDTKPHTNPTTAVVVGVFVVVVCPAVVLVGFFDRVVRVVDANVGGGPSTCSSSCFITATKLVLKKWSKKSLGSIGVIRLPPHQESTEPIISRYSSPSSPHSRMKYLSPWGLIFLLELLLLLLLLCLVLRVSVVFTRDIHGFLLMAQGRAGARRLAVNLLEPQANATGALGC